eukprot:Ihof_evm2s419 gene=Ihof_evmTU2s419
MDHQDQLAHEKVRLSTIKLSNESNLLSEISLAIEVGKTENTTKADKTYDFKSVESSLSKQQDILLSPSNQTADLESKYYELCSENSLTVPLSTNGGITTNDNSTRFVCTSEKSANQSERTMRGKPVASGNRRIKGKVGSDHSPRPMDNERKKEKKKRNMRRRQAEYRHRRTRIACSLPDVLKNPTATRYFTQYMETQSHAVLFLRFWMEVHSYSMTMQHINREIVEDLRGECTTIQDNAISIYNTYFSLQSKNTRKFLEGLAYMSGYAQSPEPENARRASTKSNDKNSVEPRQRSPMNLIRREVEANIGRKEGVDVHCFDHAQELCFKVLSRIYYPRFETSVFYTQYLREELRNNGITLLDIINNPHVLTCFTLYMDDEQPVPHEGSLPTDLLQFWLSAASFKDLVYSLEVPSRNQGEAGSQSKFINQVSMDLYEKFISLQAANPINVPPAIRREVEVNICSEQGPLIHTFECAQRYAFEIMDEYFFHPFMTSAVFLHFVTLDGCLSPISIKPIEKAKTTLESESEPIKTTALEDEFEDTLLIGNRKGLVDRLKALVPTFQYEVTYATGDSDWEASDSGDDITDRDSIIKENVDMTKFRSLSHLSARLTHQPPSRQISCPTTPTFSRVPTNSNFSPRDCHDDILSNCNTRMSMGMMDEWGNFRRRDTLTWQEGFAKEK